MSAASLKNSENTKDKNDSTKPKKDSNEEATTEQLEPDDENVKNCTFYEYVYKQQKKKVRGFSKKKVQFNSLVEIFPTNEKSKNSTNCALKSDDAESNLPCSKRNH